MKKLLLFTLLTVISIAANAQNASQKKAIEAAKTLYQDALTQLEERADDENQDYSITIEKHKNWGGSGPQTWKTTFYYYYAEDFDESQGQHVEINSLFFIREKYNWGSSDFVEEYTVNGEDKLAFYLFVGDYDMDYEDDIPEGAKVENRMYFNENGTFSSGFRQLRLSNGTTKRLGDLKASDKIVVERMKYFNTLMKQYELIIKQ